MDIYGFFLDYGSEDSVRRIEYLKKYISKQKLEKINRLKNIEDRMRSIVGDVLVRWAICNKYKLFNADLKFTTNEYGKPFLMNKVNENIEVSFSISHSGSWVVAAISPSKVGIDIEKIVDIDMKITEQFFTEEENKSLATIIQEKQLDYFYELWTLKESYIKTIGEGLSIPLNSFSININNQNITIIPKNIYNFRQYDLHPKYKLAVCSSETSFPDNINIIPMEQLENLKEFSKQISVK
ncbi:4'-phosphopantetheinyl transferase superfamily protein [Bacillus cereus group sp. BfR-BA-01446]|uniref:4'-phosphopantetheinyl transferase family protein n=1 Tax=Bacillus cereus group sp. BfR-BA-01446 TaxID=2920350 RepID=UPI001F585461|nr:4'-phosphopantetheinyl transferase superfamily protein [Bacillus cereus group sp. BfR-BA-01446]